MRVRLADLPEIDLLRQVLAKSGRLRFRALGGSMFPGIRSGDILTIKPAAAHELYAGDILFFSHAGRLLAHRLLRKKETAGGLELTTQGDFVPSADPPVPFSQVLGRVESIQRGRGTIRLNTVVKRRQGRLVAWLLHPLVLFLKPQDRSSLSRETPGRDP